MILQYIVNLPVCFIQHQPFDLAQTKTICVPDVVQQSPRCTHQNVHPFPESGFFWFTFFTSHQAAWHHPLERLKWIFKNNMSKSKTEMMNSTGNMISLSCVSWYVLLFNIFLWRTFYLHLPVSWMFQNTEWLTEIEQKWDISENLSHL